MSMSTRDIRYSSHVSLPHIQRVPEFKLSLEAETLWAQGAEGQGYIYEVDLTTGMIEIIPAFNKDGYEIVPKYTAQPIPNDLEFCIYLENNLDGNHTIRYTAKNLTGEITSDELDSKILTKEDKDKITIFLQTKNESAQLPLSLKRKLAHVATELGYSEHGPRLNKEGKPFPKHIVSSQRRNAFSGDLHTQFLNILSWGNKGGSNGKVMGGGLTKGKNNTIQAAWNRSSSQNLFSIKYDFIYQAYFRMIHSKHAAHALSLNREISLIYFQPIMTAIHKGLKIPEPENKLIRYKLLAADYTQSGTNGIQSHLLTEAMFMDNPIKCIHSLLEESIHEIIKNEVITSDDITLFKLILETSPPKLLNTSSDQLIELLKIANKNPIHLNFLLEQNYFIYEITKITDNLLLARNQDKITELEKILPKETFDTIIKPSMVKTLTQYNKKLVDEKQFDEGLFCQWIAKKYYSSDLKNNEDKEIDPHLGQEITFIFNTNKLQDFKKQANQFTTMLVQRAYIPEDQRKKITQQLSICSATLETLNVDSITEIKADRLNLELQIITTRIRLEKNNFIEDHVKHLKDQLNNVLSFSKDPEMKQIRLHISKFRSKEYSLSYVKKEIQIILKNLPDFDENFINNKCSKILALLEAENYIYQLAEGADWKLIRPKLEALANAVKEVVPIGFGLFSKSFFGFNWQSNTETCLSDLIKNLSIIFNNHENPSIKRKPR